MANVFGRDKTEVLIWEQGYGIIAAIKGNPPSFDEQMLEVATAHGLISGVLRSSKV
jgi:hypothetical protein